MVGYLKFFYGYLGRGVGVALALGLVVAVLDGFGLAMFLPLLQSAGATGETDQFEVVYRGLRAIGIPTDMVSILFVMLTFFLLKGLARFAMEYYRVVLQQRFMRGLRLQILGLLVGCGYEQFTRSHSGKIQNILGGEVSRLNQAYIGYFQLLQFSIMTLAYTVLACMANPKFAIMVVVGGVLSNLAFRWINRTTKTTSRELSAGTNDFQGFLVEIVASFKFLKATNLIEAYRRRIGKSVLDVEEKYRKIGLMSAIGTSVREPLIILVVVSALLIQVVYLGQPMAPLIFSLLLFYRALASVVAAQNSYNQFLAVSGSVENVRSFIGDMTRAREVSGRQAFAGLRERILVNDLNFSYGSVTILRGLSFHLNRFETIGIVGESGSGKTTLVNLLCSLLPVPGGTITIDGTDINVLDKASYRDKIGYVTQESQVFTDTIRNNVGFWDDRPDPGDRRIKTALEMAHAADFVAELPAGLDTVVGINGLNLSGGQRQRLSIARELYRNVELLILDEATSSLDSRSESLIQQNIDSLSGTLTLIVIAHRLSTLKKADKILFLKRGGEHEIGTFASLQKGSAKFREMIALQLI